MSMEKGRRKTAVSCAHSPDRTAGAELTSRMQPLVNTFSCAPPRSGGGGTHNASLGEPQPEVDSTWRRRSNAADYT